MKKKIVLCFALSLLLIPALTGCNGNGAQENSNRTIEPDPEPDAGTDADVEVDPCEDVQCDSGFTCVEGSCEPNVDEGYGCANPRDLGVLSGDAVHTLEFNAQGQPNLMNTSCSEDDHSAQGVIKFQVEEPTRVSSRVAGASIILVQELRVDTCSSPSGIDFCSINQQSWTALPGETYFIIVEARTGDPGDEDSPVGESGLIGEFIFEITTEEFTCYPAGERSCAGDDVEHCAGGDEIRTYECGTGCNDGECIADSCSNPLEVSASTTVEVELSSFRNTMNFQNSASCTTSGPTGSGTSTTGQDLVFSLPGLTGGQRVEIKAPDSTFVVGVMESCNESSPSCVVGNDSDGELSWEVEEAGDYYVVVNRFQMSSNSAEFSIDILD